MPTDPVSFPEDDEVKRLAVLAKAAYLAAPRSRSFADAPWMSVVRTVIANDGRKPSRAVIVVGLDVRPAP